MSLDDLETLGIPKEYNFKPPEDAQVTVDYVNGQFLVFREDDFRRLKTDFRMISESVSATMEAQSSKETPPFMLLPEQVAILSQYGHVRVRQLKNFEEIHDESTFHATGHTSSSSFQSDLDKARQIAIGRKAKEIKRKVNGNNANAKKLKVTKRDLEGIEVTEEEVHSVLKELSNEQDDDSGLINLPLQHDRDDFYEDIDHFSLPLPNTKEFRRREVVFHDLWRRGFYLTTGIRFGCHYLVYEGSPDDVHSRFLTECVDVEANLSPLKLISLSRVASQVKKTVLLAFVSDSSHIPQYLTLKWFKPYDQVLEQPGAVE